MDDFYCQQQRPMLWKPYTDMRICMLYNLHKDAAKQSLKISFWLLIPDRNHNNHNMTKSVYIGEQKGVYNLE